MFQFRAKLCPTRVEDERSVRRSTSTSVHPVNSKVDNEVTTASGGASPIIKVRRVSKPDTQVDLVKTLPAVEYIGLWLLLLSFHGLCAAFLLAQALIYAFLENPLMAYYANLLASPERRYFRMYGAVVGLLGALHLLLLVLHVLWSLKSRIPAVFPRIAMVNRFLEFLQTSKPQLDTQPASSTRSCCACNLITSVTIASLHELLSIQGKYFADFFLLRKAAEASAQIVQCYHHTTLIGRVWINDVYTAAVILNCWLTPVLDYIMLKADSHTNQHAVNTNVAKAKVDISIRGRTFCVLIDTLLTIMTCLVFPLAIFVPYARAFRPELLSFPNEMLYNDVAFPNLVRENQAVFALGFLDSVTKLFPHLSIFFGTSSLSFVLEMYPPHRVQNQLGLKNFAAKASTTARAEPQIGMTITCCRKRPLKYSDKRTRPTCAVGLAFFRRRLVPVGFFAVGALVLGLHLRAVDLAKSADPNAMKMCRQGLRPWFAVNVSCSVLEYSCYTHGVLSPSSEEFDHFQSDSVTTIVFSHCPEFVMPPIIRRFHNLLGIDLWNISITKWDTDAALDAELHPNMVYLTMAYTNMTELPQGLLTKPFPPLLADIEISVTNLHVVPHEVAETWVNVQIIYLEHAFLNEFPIALFQIPTMTMSLLDDGLESIPEDLFTTVALLDEYFDICFSYNPIKALPLLTRDGLSISYLSVDHTKLVELPAWAKTGEEALALGGSPLCTHIDTALPEFADCTDLGWNPMTDGRYPLALVATLRAISLN